MRNTNFMRIGHKAFRICKKIHKTVGKQILKREVNKISLHTRRSTFVPILWFQISRKSVKSCGRNLQADRRNAERTSRIKDLARFARSKITFTWIRWTTVRLTSCFWRPDIMSKSSLQGSLPVSRQDATGWVTLALNNYSATNATVPHLLYCRPAQSFTFLICTSVVSYRQSATTLSNWFFLFIVW